MSLGRGSMLSDSGVKSSESVGRLIQQAMPLPDGDDHYVTRGEFVRELSHLENAFDMKITTTEIRLQKWIISGVLAFILTTGVGGFSAYASLMNQFQIMRTASVDAIRANDRLDKRLQWTIEQERHDAAQDAVLKQVSPHYSPPSGGPSIPQ